MTSVPSDRADALPLVVVADDDPAIRQLLARALAAFGLAVVCVDNGAAAVEAVQFHEARLVCVLLDVMMPAMDGITAGHHIQRHEPRLPIIIMSGQAQDVDVTTLQRAGRVALLAKPFSLGELRASLQHMLTPQLLVA